MQSVVAVAPVQSHGGLKIRGVWKVEWICQECKSKGKPAIGRGDFTSLERISDF